jgi:hypothetical protein
MPYPNTEKMDDLIDWKSKPLCLTNIWIDNIDNEINNSCPTILVINAILIEHYDLWFDFLIQSHNGSGLKLKFLEDKNFTKSSYSMMMEKLEYHNLLRQLNEDKKLIFVDVMHKKQLYLCTSICLFLTRGVGKLVNFLH